MAYIAFPPTKDVEFDVRFISPGDGGRPKDENGEGFQMYLRMKTLSVSEKLFFIIKCGVTSG